MSKSGLESAAAAAAPVEIVAVVPSVQEQENVISACSTRGRFEKHPGLLPKAQAYNEACEQLQAIEDIITQDAQSQIQQKVTTLISQGRMLEAFTAQHTSMPNQALIEQREVAVAIKDATRLDLYEVCEEVKKVETLLFSLEVEAKQPEFIESAKAKLAQLKVCSANPTIGNINSELLQILGAAGEVDNAEVMGAITETFGDALYE